MKTSIQELLDQLDFIDSQDDNYKNIAILSTNNVRDIIKGLKLIEKEKKQIQKAFSDGQETPINHPTLPHYSKEEYYNDNFNQNK